MNYILSILPAIAQGSLVTLSLFAYTLVFSIPLGIVLALGNVSHLKPLRFIIQTYILIMRGTPLILQVMFVYYGIPIITHNLIVYRNFTAAIIAMSFNYAAYFAEIFRGGINSVNYGQLEAAHALGFSRIKTMRLVILPQAFVNVIPSVANEVITLVKDTALVQIIALPEMLYYTNSIVQRDLRIMPYAIAGLFYLVATIILTWIFNKIESSFNYKTA